MTEEEVRAEVGTKAIKFIDEHEKDCLTGFEMMRDFAYEVTKDLEKENAELKSDNDARKFAMAMSEKVEKQLREENAKLKNEWQEQVQKATDEGYARTLQTIQLTKAKELLERLLITSCNSDVLNLLPNCSEVLRVRTEAEQFLKDETETETETEQEEPYYVIMNMNCQYEICRRCPKSGLFKGSYEECKKWIEQKKQGN